MTSGTAFPPGVRIPAGTGPAPAAAPAGPLPRLGPSELLAALVAVLAAVAAVLLFGAGVRTDVVRTVTGTAELTHLAPVWITGAAGAALIAGIASVLAVTALVRRRGARVAAATGGPGE